LVKPLLPAAILEQCHSLAVLTTPLRRAHFLSQCSHESNNFNSVRENLNYSETGLRSTFPAYFSHGGSAGNYARKPVAIANRVYANRLGNGGEFSGDGYKYRGRGYIQITGKDNYGMFSAYCHDDCLADPDLIATKYPLQSAIWFFNVNRLWLICDKGCADAVVKQLTKRINGGDIGLEERISLFSEYYQFFCSV
jgi:putative chitinase